MNRGKDSKPILDDNGHPIAASYQKRNVYRYNKENINSPLWRLKEWDYYQASDGRYMVQLNFFNISLFSAFSAEFCDLQTGQTWSDAVIEPLTVGKNPLSSAADAPFDFEYARDGRIGRFHVEEHSRRLYYQGKTKGGRAFVIELNAVSMPDQESLTTVTPFRQKNCFFYTQKMNCMPVSGSVRIGRDIYTFERGKSFLTMDWGRGVWPWRSSWYWSNGSTMINGKLFGFELTWGFGDNSGAEATALFYDGKCHKLGAVHLENDPEKGSQWMRPWHFLSDDGRLDLTMTPFYDHKVGFVMLDLVGMKSHQVHGLFNGYVILDDGTRLEIRDMYAFAEKVRNRW